jgi:hypothetical protein
MWDTKVRKDAYIGPLNLPYAYTPFCSLFVAFFCKGSG